MELKDKLKQLRKEKGLSQAQLAELLFVNRSTVAKWENGLGLPNPESMERLEQEFEISKEDIATSEPETVIVEKNRRLRRFGETAVILGTVVVLVLMCILPFWIKETGYGLTPEMSAGEYMRGEEYFDTGDYRIYYSTWPLADENGEDFTDYYIFGGCRPIKKHFWGYTRDHCDSYMVFIDNKYVAMLHTIKGENGYYNFINYSFYDVGDFQTRFTIKDEGFDERIFSIDQVYVNGIDSPLTDEFDLEYGEVCEVQKGFFFVSSEQVQSFYIGDVQFNVDTRFVCDSLY